MGWEDRDWSQAGWGARRVDWAARLPRRGSLVLITLHVVAYLFVSLAQVDGGPRAVAGMFLRAGGPWWAILIHPIGIGAVPQRIGMLTLLLTCVALWMLASRLEVEIGAKRLAALYVLGNLLAGGLYYLPAVSMPETAQLPLNWPAGALAAFCGAAWRELRFEHTSIAGRLISVGKAAVWGGVGILALHVLLGGGALAFVTAVALSGWLTAPTLRRLTALISEARSRPARPARPRVARRRSTPEPKGPDIDAILAKISREGIDALTKAEREQLEAARRAKQ